MLRRGVGLLGLALSWQGCTFPDFRLPYAGDSGSAGVEAGASSAGVAGVAVPSGGSGGQSGSEGGGAANAGAATGGLPPIGGSLADGGGGGAGPGPEPGALAGKRRLIATHSAKCLDGGFPKSPSQHLTLGQHACDDTREQSFTLTDTSSGYYSLKIDGSSDCADVEDQGTANQTPIVRMPCAASESQEWLPVKQDGDSYFLVNRLTGKCLDVPARTFDDVSLQQYTCNVGGNQRWVIASLVPEPLPMILDDFFAPSVWMASNEAPYVVSAGRSSAACDGERAPGGLGNCYAVQVDAFPEGTIRAGATWLYPHGSWGYAPGFVLAPGAERIRFRARGATGGEQLWVKAGGAKGSAFEDSLDVGWQGAKLTSSWQSFSLDLTGQTYDAGVIVGFIWRVESNDNVVPVKFYIDDIVWE